MIILHLHTPEIAQMGQLSAAMKSKYAQRWGLNFLGYSHTLNPVRAPSWSKVIALEAALASHDWAWWIDADTAINNFDVDPRSFCLPDADMVVARDINGINCGSLLMRSCLASTDLLNAAWNRTEFLNHNWWEQAAIRAELPTSKCRVRYVDKALFNAYPDEDCSKSVVIHYPGHFTPRRGEIFTYARKAGVA